MHEHVDLGAAEGLLEVRRALGDGEALARRGGVALVVGDVGGDVGGGVEDCEGELGWDLVWVSF